MTVRSSPRLLTAEDLLRIDSPYRDCELWDGLAVVREPTGGSSDAVNSRIAGWLQAYVRTHDLGWVTGSEQGFLVARAPDRVLAADAAFVTYERMPEVPARGFWPVCPDVVVETRSPGDSWTSLLTKAGVWIGHGARVVWAIDPLRRRVLVLRPGAEPVVRRSGESLDAAPVLPGLAVPLDELFARLPYEPDDGDVSLHE